MTNWWTTLTVRRTLPALFVALVAVPILAVTSKVIVERTTPWVYEIHWTTTVPLLILLFTAVVNRIWNEHAAKRA